MLCKRITFFAFILNILLLESFAISWTSSICGRLWPACIYELVYTETGNS